LNRFSFEIRETIFRNKEIGDGFSVNINAINGIVFVRVELFWTDHYAYIIDYLKSIGTEIEYPTIGDLKSGGNLIRIENFDERLTNELIDDLNKHENIEDLVQTIKVFEKGAGDWRVELLIKVTEGVSISIVGAYLYELIKGKSQDARSTVIKGFDHDDILKKTSELSDINKKDLTISDVEYDPHNDKKIVFITSRYADIKIQINSSNEIIHYSIDQKSKTKI
jgi:hypothetical protein